MKTVDISGMDKGCPKFGYEWGCQIILCRALRWLKIHGGAKPEFKGFKNITGVLLAENALAQDMEKFALDHAKLKEYGATGAMVQYSLIHAMKRNSLGEEEYFSHFKDDPGRVFEFDETDAFPEDPKANESA